MVPDLPEDRLGRRRSLQSCRQGARHPLASVKNSAILFHEVKQMARKSPPAPPKPSHKFTPVERWTIVGGMAAVAALLIPTAPFVADLAAKSFEDYMRRAVHKSVQEVVSTEVFPKLVKLASRPVEHAYGFSFHFLGSEIAEQRLPPNRVYFFATDDNDVRISLYFSGKKKFPVNVTWMVPLL
jgi:hypothetical protein